MSYKNIFFVILLTLSLLVTGCASREVQQNERSDLFSYTLVSEQPVDEAGYIQAKTILEERLQQLGYEDYLITADKNGITLKVDEGDPDKLSSICRRGELYFREGTQADGAILIENDELSKAEAAYSEADDQFVVYLYFNEEGAEKFAEATERLTGEVISIWLDGECLTSPTVSSPIYGGTAVINMPDGKDATIMLAAQLNSGKLPFELKMI